MIIATVTSTPTSVRCYFYAEAGSRFSLPYARLSTLWTKDPRPFINAFINPRAYTSTPLSFP